MMNRLTSLYDTTQHLHDLLQQEIEPKERESIISKVNDLIEKRGEQMNALKPPFSEEEKATAKKIMQLNKLIEHGMLLLFDDLKVELRQMKKQKQSNRKYIHPYETIQARDGIYLDRKK
ncbi:flagellar protein FliT [Virgibacillus dokdonensis]|nr:flagellar protein FliT [Virgibacillus dokdonensis]